MTEAQCGSITAPLQIGTSIRLTRDGLGMEQGTNGQGRATTLRQTPARHLGMPATENLTNTQSRESTLSTWRSRILSQSAARCPKAITCMPLPSSTLDQKA